MKIWILTIYPNDYKFMNEAMVYGYYTDFRVLRHDIIQHKEILGLKTDDIDKCYDHFELSNLMLYGFITEVTSDEWNKNVNDDFEEEVKGV